MIRIEKIFLSVVVVKAILMALYIVYGGLALGGDEAQYWLWGKNLAWGYYSKPPMIAWQIWATTSVFGDTELGVRIGAVMMSAFIAGAIYLAVFMADLGRRAAAWSGIAFALSPLGFLSSLFTTTDGGLVLFWTLALSVTLRALAKDQVPSNIWLGLCILAGALYKWAAFLFWLFVIPLWRRKVVVAIMISLLALLPSLWWNWHHGFPTFRHVWSSNVVGQSHVGGNVGSFVGAQVALLGPVLSVMVFVTLRRALSKSTVPIPVFVASWMLVTIVGIYVGLSIFKKMQGNWCVFAYPAAFVPLAWYFAERKYGTLWLTIASATSTVAMMVAFAIPSSSRVSPPYAMNPFRAVMGWENLAPALQQAGYDESQFLFSDRYQTSSLLSFYGPGQSRAYFFNISHARRNQFDYWPNMAEEQKGNTGFFVWAENVDRRPQNAATYVGIFTRRLSPYFRDVVYLGEFPLVMSDGKAVKTALIFRCEEYNGASPPAVQQF